MAEIIHCQKCGNAIGKIVTVAGVKVLNVNGIYVINLKGVCSNCGAMFYYSVSVGELKRAFENLERV